MMCLKLTKFVLEFWFLLFCFGNISNFIGVNDFILFSFFLVILFLEFLLHPKRSFVNLLNFITIILNILGVFAIEHSDSSYYLYEIEQWISKEGSISLLLLYQYFFLLGINFVIREKSLSRLSFSKIYYKNIFLVGLYLMLFVTYGVIIKYKPAPILGVDRFAYDKEILGIFGQITNLLFYFALGLGVLYFSEKKKRYLILLGLIIFSFLLKGHKFWNLIEIIFLFFIPYVIYIIRDKAIKLILRVSIGLLFFIFSAISINVYYFPSFEPLDYARQRLSQEGQLWWSTYKNYTDEIRLNEISEELSTYVNYNEYNQYYVGMYKVMRLNTTPERFEWKLDKLSRFTYSTPSLIFYHLGSYLGIFAMLILGILFGGWFKLVFYSISSGNLILTIISSRLFYILRKGVKDGDLYKFFSVEFVLLLFFILIVWIVHSYFIKSRSYLINKTN
ncbi:DUF6418 domain-containing protein [Lonepinella sp. BR2474]|uniref:DUF6418 domain-containing protein n=1 Tax=Lonepinella sp. BR2474 TaxID=3434548 RepID=UPI003F6DC252